MRKTIYPILTLLAALYLPMASAFETVEITEQQIANLGIEVTQLKSASAMPLFRAPGQISIPPAREFIVSAPEDGLVSKVEVAVGENVKKGQTLAHLNSPDLLTLQRNLLDAASQLNLARAKYQRDETLYNEGVIAERRWQETRSDYNVQLTAVSAARQMLEIAGMADNDIDTLLRSRRLSSLLPVRSPVAGAVLEKMVVAGQRVDILAPMFRVASLETLWLDIDVPQEKLNLVKMSDRVEIENTGASARVILIGKSVDPQNQTVLVRARIEEGAGQVRPGQTVGVRLIQPSEKNIFRVPAVAIARSAGESFVFIRTGEGFEARPVQVLGTEEEEAVIEGPLKAGEPVAIQGVVALKASLMGHGGGD